MTQRRTFMKSALALSAAGLLLALPGCGSTETIRYKMVVEVETPQGVKTGAAVREVTFHEGYQGPSIAEDRGGISVKGEAVVVDLPDGRTLFALLTAPRGDVDYGARIFDRAFDWHPAYAGYEPTALSKQPMVELFPTHPKTVRFANTSPLPMFATFSDLKDPTSVTLVKPDALDKAFGPGVRLKRVFIEKTHEAVTLKIEKRLVWLKNGFPRIPPSAYPPIGNQLPLFSVLTDFDFRRGMGQ